MLKRLVWVTILLLLVACGAPRTARPTAVPTQAPTIEPSPEPTEVVIPVPTEVPTPAATTGPRTTDPAGVAPLDKDNCPEEYPIKGNIRDDGGMIYHEPNYRSYGATDPEVCFALVEDAVSAGFSRPENN